MFRINRRTAGLLVIGALASSALVPAVGQAAKKKTYKWNMLSSNGTQNGTKIGSDYSGKPLGKCKMTGTLVIPKTEQTWKCKGGTFHVSALGTTGAANDAKGTWKISKGTGKFKGIKGKGTWSGQISTGIFRYKATATY